MAVLEIETDFGRHFINFNEIILEITNECNMSGCAECYIPKGRAYYMSEEIAKKALQFFRRFSNRNRKVVISGGEPSLHRKFNGIVEFIEKHGCNNVAVSTNGSLTENHLEALRRFEKTTIMPSINSSSEELHDFTKGFSGAFAKTVGLVKTIKKKYPNFKIIIKSTIRPSQIGRIGELVNFIKNDLGCDGVIISEIIPNDFTKNGSDMSIFFGKEQTGEFIEQIWKVRNEFETSLTRFDVYSTSPFQQILSPEKNYICMAGIRFFSVNYLGIINPCPNLRVSIGNVIDLTLRGELFRNSKIVHALLDRNIQGKCKNCHYNKFSFCAGCRARVYNMGIGNLNAEDPNCPFDLEEVP